MAYIIPPDSSLTEIGRLAYDWWRLRESVWDTTELDPPISDTEMDARCAFEQALAKLLHPDQFDPEERA